MFDQPIVFTDDMEEARKVSKPKTDSEQQWFDDCVEESAGFTLITDEGKIVVCAKDLDTVVHELAHATFYTLLSRGFELEVDNHEAFCYLQGYLFKQWMEKMEC